MGVHEDFEKYRTYSHDIKNLDKIYNKHLEYQRTWQRENIVREKGTEKEHDDLINACARILANTELSRKTGFEFYFTDPLTELSEQEGNRIFDLLFYNNKDGALILVDCKTSIAAKVSKHVFKQLSGQIETIENYVEYLEKQIGDRINSQKIEYVLFTPQQHCEKVEIALGEQQKKVINERVIKNPRQIKVWNYLPTEGKIQIEKNSWHENKELTDALLKGVPILTPGNEKYDIPITINSHPYRIIEYILLENLYANKIEEDEEKKKMFKLSEFAAEMDKRLILGIRGEQKLKLVRDKTARIISHGLEYDIIQRIENREEEYKIICQGTKLNTIKSNLSEKYYTNWSFKKAEEKSKELAIDEHKKSRGEKPLESYDKN